jgi:formylglycine-generating enzyme required for sulfatase activity
MALSQDDIQALFDAGDIDEAARDVLLRKLRSVGEATQTARVGGDVSEATIVAGSENLLQQGIVINVGPGGAVRVTADTGPDARFSGGDELAAYLRFVVRENRLLRLQGIHSHRQQVSIELDSVYITLRATHSADAGEEQEWLARTAACAPGEDDRAEDPHVQPRQTADVSVHEALKRSRRLVVLGDPGSGKTTLLRFLAFTYASGLGERDTEVVRERVGFDECGMLPLLVPLRQLGAYLAARGKPELDGCGVLLDYWAEFLDTNAVQVKRVLFEDHLRRGEAVVLFDGLDEVADLGLRGRVSRVVEALVRRFPECRYVVTSRIVGYDGPVRLAEDFRVATVREFTLADVEEFLTKWHLCLFAAEGGVDAAVLAKAAAQTRDLVGAVRDNDRIRELAINPLLLTVIALVHRNRVKLPDRRSELYREAVEVLLGAWDAAKAGGAVEEEIVKGRTLESKDKRAALQAVALYMHERQRRDIAAAELEELLARHFGRWVSDAQEREVVVRRFLDAVKARAGLLAERGNGVYGFSHLTFQEYLAALQIAARDDYLKYSLARAGEPWWREVIRLEAGHLSTEGGERADRLIKEIASRRREPEPYYNLVLAADCIRDVGETRTGGALLARVRDRLERELQCGTRSGRAALILHRFIGGTFGSSAMRRVAAAEALFRIGGKRLWTMPHGEPVWVEVPSGPSLMGEGEDEEQVESARFLIATAPITNAQYRLFVVDTECEPPAHWDGDSPPSRLESHPVVNVSCDVAAEYCRWLSQKTGQDISLPTEEQWEKGARGTDGRVYPWGNEFVAEKCNCHELGLGDTTPVGIFPQGASPWGCLDMTGNVSEWTLPGRLHSEGDYRVLRGGSFTRYSVNLRCACRLTNPPGPRFAYVGFRVVLSP